MRSSSAAWRARHSSAFARSASTTCRRRLGGELLVREAPVERDRAACCSCVGLAAQARALLVEIHHAGERHARVRSRRATAPAPPHRRAPRRSDAARARATMRSRRSRASAANAVHALRGRHQRGLHELSGWHVVLGAHLAERRRSPRAPPRSRRRRRPRAAVGAGHAATARWRSTPAWRGSGTRCQSASVMNGMIGCSRRSACVEGVREHRAGAPRDRRPSAARRGFTDSRYQSASSFQTKRRAASAYSSSRSPALPLGRASTRRVGGRAGPSAASQSAIAASSRSRIQWSAAVSRVGVHARRAA